MVKLRGLKKNERKRYRYATFNSKTGFVVGVHKTKKNAQQKQLKVNNRRIKVSQRTKRPFVRVNIKKI